MADSECDIDGSGDRWIEVVIRPGHRVEARRSDLNGVFARRVPCDGVEARSVAYRFMLGSSQFTDDSDLCSIYDRPRRISDRPCNRGIIRLRHQSGWLRDHYPSEQQYEEQKWLAAVRSRNGC